jgi:hypothetical protein
VEDLAVTTKDKIQSRDSGSLKPEVQRKRTISSISDDAMMIATVGHKLRSVSIGLARRNALRNRYKLCNNLVTVGSG